MRHPGLLQIQLKKRSSVISVLGEQSEGLATNDRVFFQQTKIVLHSRSIAGRGGE
jgi:hypothetical protein